MATIPEQLYEQTLVMRCQLGDESAFQELLQWMGPRLAGFVRKLAGEQSNHPDLVQEIWIAIFKALPKLQDAGKFHPWAFRIARDCVYKDFRKRKNVPRPLELQDVAELADETSSQSSEDPFDHETMEQCLNLLSPEHREVLLLRFYQDLSYEEIAQITSISLGTVRSRIFNAKRALKTTLESIAYENK